MTIKELYEYAKEHNFEDKTIKIIGICEAGYAGAEDDKFYLKEQEETVDLLVTEDTGQYIPKDYSDAVPMFDTDLFRTVCENCKHWIICKAEGLKPSQYCTDFMIKK